MAVYYSDLFNTFVAVFSGGVLIGLNFVILNFETLSLDLSNCTSFFYLFLCRLLRRADDVLYTKLVSSLRNKLRLIRLVWVIAVTIIAE